MRTRWWLALIWAGFSVRLAFYATAFPLWEGFDEWPHFAVVRHMAGGEPLVARDAGLPADVAASLRLVPMPPTPAGLFPGALSHEEFWALPADAREARQRELRAIPADLAPSAGNVGAYEALQPPLYYWLMTPVLWLSRSTALVTQVFMLRWASILIASLIVPAVFLLGRTVFADDQMALGAAVVVALMPELAISVARVGNECLAVMLYTVVTWLAVRRRNWLAMGAALGLGLITKAYFLAAVAGVALTFFAPRAFAIAALLSGWWYVRNLLTTGTLTGLSEAVLLRGAPRVSMLSAVQTLSWGKAVDSILFSHLYFGGWSSLMVRSWMYHLFYLVMVVAGVGLIGLWRRRELRSCLWMYGVFWLAQLYNVVLIYRTKGVPTSMGWYLYAVVGAEVALLLAGLRRVLGRYAVGLAAILFGLLDLYAMHAIALPYYTGMLGRKANGALAGVQLSGFRAGEVFERLTIFKPPVVTESVMVGLWAAYVAATILLMASGVRIGMRIKPA
jgi:hypothetical protein